VPLLDHTQLYMRSYRTNEADIEIPEEWKDTTIHAFVLPGEEGGGGAASFVITRDPDAAGMDLQEYADQQLVKAAQQLPSYSLVKRDKRTIAEQPALQSDFTWTTPERVTVRQRQACLRHGDLVLVLTLTARDATFPKYEPIWGQVIDSFRLRPITAD
jgi:hypothetical protein